MRVMHYSFSSALTFRVLTFLVPLTMLKRRGLPPFQFQQRSAEKRHKQEASFRLYLPPPILSI